MLVLLDIDGTLVRCGGSGRQALNHAFSEVCGVDDALEGVRLAGSTDRIIIEDACRAVGITLDDDQVTAVFDAYVTHLRALLEGEFPGYAVLPGARQVAEALDRSAAHVVGLATGNIESAARVKLAPAGLNEHLPFGGFGSDGRARTELLARGIERGQALAEGALGAQVSADQIWVVGDTERDVRAARALGVRSVGVLHGSGHRDALTSEEPDLLVDSLLSPSLWAALGLPMSDRG